MIEFFRSFSFDYNIFREKLHILKRSQETIKYYVQITISKFYKLNTNVSKSNKIKRDVNLQETSQNENYFNPSVFYIKPKFFYMYTLISWGIFVLKPKKYIRIG